MKSVKKYNVWYAKDPTFRENPNIHYIDFKKTHVLVRSLYAKGLDGVFHRQQAEVWSPNGEAVTLIRKLGLQHTSMSVGDVIEDTTDGCGMFYEVGRYGFNPF